LRLLCHLLLRALILTCGGWDFWQECTLRGHSENVISVAYLPDGKHIVSGSNDKTVKIWDAQSGEEKCTLRGHSGILTSVAYSPDGKHIASASWDKTVKIWDSTNGQEVIIVFWHRCAICCCVH
jgi:eukaryotic-like serine/threonine-protein kinase